MDRVPFFNIAFMKSFVALIFSILIRFTLFLISRVEPAPVYSACQNTTFAPNSLYQSNLNDLLGQLSSRATTGDYFYQNRSGSSDNTVYGSYFCLNYVSIGACSSCVATAAKEAPEVCPSGKQVLIWYEFCMLRYANRSFFFTLETQPAVYLSNVRNASNPSKFAEALAEVMSDFVTQAKNAAKSFLTTSINISGFQTMYSLMQCTPDLSGADCTKCLENAIASLPTCCVGNLGGRVLSPSCYIRFEVYLFYKGSSTSSAPPPGNGSRISRPAIAAIVIAVTIASLALGFCLLRRRRLSKMKQCDVVRPENGIDSLQFELVTIETATKNFSQDYKLGEGGFGEVYKGIFASGQEIAVKRLSKSSGQGTEEFKNEVALVAKLQHRNLVRLLGFCLGGGETILVYEFVPNKSLDYFLFDPEKRGLLDWSTRSKIVGGICRGILYLHEDSRLRVIHRDLKASNVLLDGDMNPKISDFGMARMVGIDQTQGNTKRIVGTYGYMAPEYAMEGLYSVKSDVFSFGVLLLEILSGKKNSGFHLTKFAPSLLAYAWQLWNEERGIELMDQFLTDSCPPNEFYRYVHIGLLCVQEDAYNRPTMSSILLMLTSENTSLPKPKRPAFFVGRLASDNNQELGVNGCSDNGLTISNFVPR